MPKIRSSPSDLDKRRFIQRSFETIPRHFETTLDELAEGQNSVESDFKRTSEIQFTAELFVNGKSRRRCKIWLYNDGIAFSEDSPFGWGGANNSYNEMLSLADNQLALRTLMGMGWGDEDKDLRRINRVTRTNFGRLSSYTRLQSFLLSYVLVTPGLEKIEFLSTQISLWGTARTIAVSMMLTAVTPSILLISGTLHYHSFILGAYAAGMLLIWGAIAAERSAYERVCSTLFALAYIVASRALVANATAEI